MAYTDSHVQLSWGGSVAGEDVWTNSVAITSPVTLGLAPQLFDELDPIDFKPAVDGLILGSAGLALYNDLRWYKLALIGTDGKYLEEAKIYDNPSPQKSSSSFAVPPQDSVVISWLTDAPRGLARRGRMYLPAGYADAQTANGRIVLSQQNAILTRATNFINAVNTVAQTAVNSAAVCVMSGVRTGATRVVSGVEVGNLIDTQRRRRNRLTETYVEGSLTP